MIGQKFDSNSCGSFTVIGWSGKLAIVEFDDGTVVHTYKNSVKAGTVKNPNHPSVYGVGYTGVGKYKSANHNKEYNLWKDILRCCYSKSYQDERLGSSLPTIDPSWFNFQTFVGDVQSIPNFEKSYGAQGWVLDKDIMVHNNTHYSLATLCFVPKEIDNQFSKKPKTKYPKGVHVIHKKFTVYCNVEGKNAYLGTFDNIDDAEDAYNLAKETEIRRLAEKHREYLDPTVYAILIGWRAEDRRIRTSP